MKTVYKFPFTVQDEICLQMPKGAQILSVQMQHGVPVIWALVDPDRDTPVVERQFHLAGTGHPLPNALGKFVGTFQMMNGDLVLHLFERLGS